MISRRTMRAITANVYSPLLPLFLLLFTGPYMFVLPYAAEWRGGRRAGELG